MNDTDLLTASWLEYFEYISFGIYDWVLVFALIFLLLEFGNDAVTKRLNGERILESLSSIFTLVPYFVIEGFIFAGAVYLFYSVHEMIPWKQPVNAYTAMLVLLLADFAYYAEHYFFHKVRLFWLSHSVHHSSTMMNTATAFRFSMFDPILPVFFHFPLILMGFHPMLVIGAEIIVLAYQFWLHNEMIGKLGPLEWLFNTPSHHRVHHASDEKYLDKNFGGILIIWDRIFGTFKAEEELPNYGLTTPMTSKNPITVQFYEFPRLYKDLLSARSPREFFGYLFHGPGWRPEGYRARKAAEAAAEKATAQADS